MSKYAFVLMMFLASSGYGRDIHVPQEAATLQIAIDLASQEGQGIERILIDAAYDAEEFLSITRSDHFTQLTIEGIGTTRPVLRAPQDNYDQNATLIIDALSGPFSLTIRNCEIRMDNPPLINRLFETRSEALLAMAAVWLSPQRTYEQSAIFEPNHCRIENCVVFSTQNGAAFGVWNKFTRNDEGLFINQADTHIEIINSRFVGVIQNDSDGLACWSGEYGIIRGNHIAGFNEGIHLSLAGHGPDTAPLGGALVIAHNIIEHGQQNALHITHDSGTVQVLNNIFNSGSYEPGGVEQPIGLFANGVEQLAIHNNLFRSVHGDALVIDNAHSEDVNDADVLNNIFFDNNPLSLPSRVDIRVTDNVPLDVALQYNCNFGLSDMWEKANALAEQLLQAGPGNIELDPMLNFMGHLRQESPCIDAGHPAQDYRDRDQSRNDMGAFGGPWGEWSIVISE